MIPPPPSSTLFPYTTLFRSDRHSQRPRDLRHERIGEPPRHVHACARRGQNKDSAENTARRCLRRANRGVGDRKSTRLNSSHGYISYAVFCLKKKKKKYKSVT